jgi:membrane-associated protease RseP (regulator of RpoE activity)
LSTLEESHDPFAPMPEQASPQRHPRYWLHWLLLLLALLSSTMVGARLNYNFVHELPIFGGGDGPDGDAFPFRWAFQHPSQLVHGLPFSLCLMAFFLAHEMGHYLYCRKHRVAATLPFFLPFPSLIGTLGAVIRIKAPFRDRRVLFDIGVAGPLAGMVVAIPLVFVGLLLSKPLAPSAFDSDVIFGTPLGIALIRALMLHSQLPHALAMIEPHPVLVAGWVGLFATALNLIPGGQLDGGHILYALAPRWQRTFTRFVSAALLFLGYFVWAGWILWGLILLLPLFRHPYVPEMMPLSRKQKWVAVLALLIFVLTFQFAPFQHESVPELIRQYRH